LALLALVVGVCEEPQENQDPVDPWVTLESRVRLDLEDFLAYLAFQDPQDQLVLKETGDSSATLGLQVSEKRDLRVQRVHMDHLGHLELVSQDSKASEDQLGKLVGVVCPVVLDPSVHPGIVSSARLSRCKRMRALRRRVEDEGKTKKGEKATKAHSQTKTAHRIQGSYCSIKLLIKLITMAFTMMVILKRVSNTATEVTATEVSHPTVFIQYLLLRLIIVTSGFK
jgi:hypothetical protein